jgi:hypothetical protein
MVLSTGHWVILIVTNGPTLCGVGVVAVFGGLRRDVFAVHRNEQAAVRVSDDFESIPIPYRTINIEPQGVLADGRQLRLLQHGASHKGAEGFLGANCRPAPGSPITEVQGQKRPGVKIWGVRFYPKGPSHVIGWSLTRIDNLRDGVDGLPGPRIRLGNRYRAHRDIGPSLANGIVAECCGSLPRLVYAVLKPVRLPAEHNQLSDANQAQDSREYGEREVGPRFLLSLFCVAVGMWLTGWRGDQSTTRKHAIGVALRTLGWTAVVFGFLWWGSWGARMWLAL